MRICKWLVPVVVFGFLLAGVAPRAGADESKKGGVKGSVTDKDGKAVSGAKVRLQTPHEKGKTAGEAKSAGHTKLAKGAKEAPIAEGTTDSDGKFELKDIAPGSYTIFANMKGVGGAKQDVTIEEGKTAEVTLQLGDTHKK